jgi:hypothetical protein
VKQSKNQKNVFEGQGKSKDKTWKSKAQQPSETNKALHKRQKELIVIRDL